jgi:excisionase family DNA binding protein
VSAASSGPRAVPKDGDDGAPILSRHDALKLAAAALEAQAAALRALALEAGEEERATQQGAMRVQDVAKRWGVGLAVVYDLVSKKRLRAFRVGMAVCIPIQEVLNYERRRTT